MTLNQVNPNDDVIVESLPAQISELVHLCMSAAHEPNYLRA